ncbi:MAG: metallophosphoesterase [Rhodospirillum sp.]|nr:metallophosphoesterase [Rhodospirillum sp.]MCF8487965.1 metallophosphoesterase [Rhodospirillum sp.]MCF8499312.1 metallophosphoesterase [Rhodospirillum sp.]
MSKTAPPPPPPRSRVRRFAFWILAIFAPAHLYVGVRLVPDLPGGPAIIALAASYCLLSTFLIPFGTLARLYARRPLVDPLVWAGTLAMGWFSSLFVLTLVRDLTLLIPASRAWTSQSALAVVGLSLLVTAVGFINARKVARVVRVSVPLKTLPQALDGFTIAQLSDIHVGSTIKGGSVRRMVERTNRLNADMVAITGDVVDGDVSHLGKDVAPLGDLHSRHGTFVVTGNHEFYSGADPWMAAFAELGMHPLRNAHEILDHDGAKLVVAGVEDFSAGRHTPDRPSDPAKALEGAPEGLLRILLAHQPRSAEAASAVGADLQLSGHTHGGQIWPWNYAVRMQQPLTAGLHRWGSMWVYVSRGTGYWGPPKRFGAPSEITLITLTRG